MFWPTWLFSAAAILAHLFVVDHDASILLMALITFTFLMGFLMIVFRNPKYRIIKIKDTYPWQIQERVWFFFWRDKYLSFSSILTAEKEINLLLNNKK